MLERIGAYARFPPRTNLQNSLAVLATTSWANLLAKYGSGALFYDDGVYVFTSEVQQ